MSFLPMHSTSKSTITQVKGTVSTTASEIAVVDAAAFPYAPNFATIGIDTKTEVILYQGVDLENNKLTGCLRGQSHTTPREWESGNFIYHSQTEDIMNAMVKYIRDLSNQGGGGGGGTGGVVASGAGAHNAVYRGKWLGNAVTDEQYAAISSGTFDDLYIGDYWTIGDVNYRIAAFDYYLRSGYTEDLLTHHVVIVPDTTLYRATINATNTTTGGYVGSLMYKTNLEPAKATIKEAFDGHILKHKAQLVNATSNNKASGWAWFDSEVELMNETMVYGSVAFGQSSIGCGFNIGAGKSQFPLFALRHDIIYNRQVWWLRDVCSGTTFSCVGSGGSTGIASTSASHGVRPAFSIC